MQAHAIVDCGAQVCGPNALTMSGNLHDDLVGGSVVTQHDRNPGHALAANEANADGSVAPVSHDRSKATLQEIDRAYPLVAQRQDFLHR